MRPVLLRPLSCSKKYYYTGSSRSNNPETPLNLKLRMDRVIIGRRAPGCARCNLEFNGYPGSMVCRSFSLGRPHLQAASLGRKKQEALGWTLCARPQKGNGKVHQCQPAADVVTPTYPDRTAAWPCCLQAVSVVWTVVDCE
jgi:hypothetical protein